jgi:hypothetical protein
VVGTPPRAAAAAAAAAPAPAAAAAAPAAGAGAAAAGSPLSSPTHFLTALAAVQSAEGTATLLATLASTPELARASEERTGITAVMKAIRGKNVEAVRALLKAYPAGVSLPDKNSATPLHHAVVYQNLEIIALLVKEGADQKAKDVHAETPLELARKLFKQGHHKTEAVVQALAATA